MFPFIIPFRGQLVITGKELLYIRSLNHEAGVTELIHIADSYYIYQNIVY